MKILKATYVRSRMEYTLGASFGAVLVVNGNVDTPLVETDLVQVALDQVDPIFLPG